MYELLQNLIIHFSVSLCKFIKTNTEIKISYTLVDISLDNFFFFFTALSQNDKSKFQNLEKNMAVDKLSFLFVT